MRQIDTIEATPTKRLFYSIIADYDLNRSICELIDNALDIWVRGRKARPINIELVLDLRQQTIRIIDNAGGLEREKMTIIVGPGQTDIDPNEELIGFFGVGSKRAVVALSQDIKIITRHNSEHTYMVSIDERWLQIDSWELPLYEVDDIQEGSTIIELHRLREELTEELISNLRAHLSATYAFFLVYPDVRIILNGEAITPIFYNDWSYPPDFEPRRLYGEIPTDEGIPVRIEVLAGLSSESSPTGGDYGFYFYCNDRLIARGLRSYEVGFTKGKIGSPHPKLALLKVIISLKGAAKHMPWNSSKSGVYYNHPIFLKIRDFIVNIGTQYASLERRWVGEWPEKIFSYPTGTIIEEHVTDFTEATTSYLPSLPKTRLRYIDKIKQQNKKIGEEKPWTVGLYEGMIAVDLIFKQKLQSKNRICLVVLDSILEISMKEYLINDSGASYNTKSWSTICNSRTLIQNELKKYKRISKSIWRKIDYYYKLRCKLIHEIANVEISDEDVMNYKTVVEYMLNKLFKLQFKEK